MKKTILALAVVLTLILGVFAFSVFGEESDGSTVVFAPYTDADGLRQYCACGNKFVADENGTIRYVNGENGCKNHKDENGVVVDGCDGTLITWKPCNFNLLNDADGTGNTFAYQKAEDGTVTGMAYYLTKNIKAGTQQFGFDAGNYYLDLNGYSFTRNNARVIGPKAGVNLYITDTSSDKDGYIASVDTDNTPMTGQACTFFMLNANCSVTLFDGIIDGTKESTSNNVGGAAFYVGDSITGCRLSQFGGTIKSGTSTGKRSGFVMGNGVYNLYAGNVIGGSGMNGGALYLGTNATFNMYGGSITGGETTGNGGSVYSNGTIYMYGGSIAGGTTTTQGDVVALAKGSFTMTGGTIAKGESDGLYLPGETPCAVTVGGNAQIEDFRINGNSTFVTAEDFTGSVGLSVVNKGYEVTMVKDTQQAACFTSNEAGFSTKITGSLGILVNDEPAHANHCVCAGYAQGKGEHTCEDAQWIAWGYLDAEKTKFPTVSGNYYLVADISITSTQNVPDTEQVNLCLNGHTVKMSKTGRINVRKGVSITDCAAGGQILSSVANTTGATYRCVFYVYNGATVNLYNAIIDAREAKVADGAIAHIGNDGASYLNIYAGTYYGATLTLDNVTLAQTRGGAFNITAGSVMNMYGGQIIGGESTGKTTGTPIGGSVAIYSGTLNMRGGSITEGVENSVYLRSHSTCHLNLSGNATIDDLYVDGTKKFTVSEDFTGSVGLTVATKNHEVVTLKNARQAACFTSNEEGYSTKTTGALGVLVNDDPVHENHCICGGHGTGKGEHTCQDAQWIAWGYLDTEKTSLPSTSGNYYLVDDISLAKSVSIANTEDVSICLNGHDITTTGTDRVWAVRKYLSLTDCAAEQGVITTKYDGRYGGVFFIYENATVEIFAGTLDASQAVVAQGAVAIIGNSAGATMNIYGGTLLGATTVEGRTSTNGSALERRGAALYMISTSTLNIYGGTISGGEAKNGGTIYAASGNTVNISGGTITGGTATNNGGNICCLGTLNITGGTITGGSALQGGNIYTGSKSASIANAQISGGIAHGDTAQAYGGNIYASSDITLVDSTISGGMATSGVTAEDGTFTPGKASAGGNLYIPDDVTASFTGCTITGGQATHGGNIRNDGTMTLTDCTISDGNATLMHDGTTNGNGGNLYCTGGSVTTLTGCTLTGGLAQRAGSIGAWGQVTITDTSVTGGHANVNGGNIMTYSNGYITLQGNTVISDGTAQNNGGNIAFSSNANKISTIGDGVQILGGAADNLGDCIFHSGGVLKLQGAPVITGIFANNSDSAYSMDVSELNVTEPIRLGIGKLGVVANSDSDKSAMFILNDAAKVLRYDSEAMQLVCAYAEIENVYVDATNGSDDNVGNASAPVKTFAHAMIIAKDNGTIHLVGTVEVTDWEAHGKTLTITGGELVLPETRFNLHDNVTFTDLTITMTMCTTNTSSNYGSYFFYCNGFKTVIEEDVVVQYFFNGEITTNPYRSLTYLKNDVETAVTATSTIYGGGPSATGVLSGTDLTILGGLWGNVYGGSNGVDIEGDVHLTVGGKINEGVDYVSHTISSRHVILGGSRAANISGTVYMNVTGGMYHTSTHGGTNGEGSIGAIEMRVTGGRGMALYGGGRSSGVLTVLNGVNFYLEGGEWEQVFGGTLSNCLTGDVNLYVTGGKITRRLYGGCYSNCDESSGDWTADNFVTGDVNLYIGSGAEITCDLKDPDAGWESIITGGKYADRGIYGHSRRAAPGASDAENARIIFLDQAAYDKHKGNLKAQDTIMSNIMSGVTAADYICYLGTNASGNVITVGATEVEDNVSNALDLPAATATITVPEGSYTYEGTALTPATVSYSDNWTYGELEITYTNNDKAGTATASITYEGVTATTAFTVVEACKHTNTTTAYAQVALTETHIVTVTCECGEQISQTTENCADEDKNYVCDLCEGALTKPVAQVGENQYASLAEAIASANGNAVQLLADCGDVTVESDLYIDLNGYHLTGVTVAENAKLYLLDSATNDCEGAYGTASVTGAVAGGENYLVVSEDGVYSAHYYELKLTHVSLDPANDALGYKAQLLGDEIVQTHVKSFGFNLGVAGGLQKTYTKDATDFDGIFTLRLKGIMAANGGEMAITGSAFVIFDVDDQTVTTDAHTTTMKDTLETVNTNFESYTADQQAAVKAMVIKYASKMEDWAIDKIKA